MTLLPREEFALTTTYLNTASHGLLPARTLAAMRTAMDEMAEGRIDMARYLAAAEAARSSFAALAGVPAGRVAIGSAVSVHAGLIAASLPEGAEVVCVENEFSSLVTPFAQAGMRLRAVPLEKLADAVGPRTALVAVSAAQSFDGRTAPLAELREAAAAHGARTLVDTSQSSGWLPLDAADFDFTVCGAFKWLLCPRGVSFLTVPEDGGGLRAVQAGWMASGKPWDSTYGPVERLAGDARRYDATPAFLPYVGAAASLDLVAGLDAGAVGAHDRALAGRFRAGLAELGHAPVPGDSPIVSVPGLGGAAAELAEAGVVVASRGGGLRAAFHVYNTEEHVDRLLTVLAARGRGREAAPSS